MRQKSPLPTPRRPLLHRIGRRVLLTIPQVRWLYERAQEAEAARRSLEEEAARNRAALADALMRATQEAELAAAKERLRSAEELRVLLAEERQRHAAELRELLAEAGRRHSEETRQLLADERQRVAELESGRLVDLILRPMETRVDYINHLTLEALKNIRNNLDLLALDVPLLLNQSGVLADANVDLLTEHPIALNSDDHIFPYGTAHDNTRRPEFVGGSELHFPGKRLTYLDVGCSGGGLVYDFALKGHRAIGIEGSDFSRQRDRAIWRLLSDRLFTADVTKPFQLVERSDRAAIKCDIISAWEVMEHFAEEQLPTVLKNVLDHLTDDGLFVGSISTQEDGDAATGAVYHLTVKPKPWWAETFARHGLEFTDRHKFAVDMFARGVGNGPLDLDFRRVADAGFHFVARRAR